MQKLKLAGVLIFLTFFAMGCASASFKKVAFIAVDNTKTVYEMAGPALALLHKEGKISDNDRDKAIEYGHRFAAKWEVASATLKAYKRVENAENANKFQVALDAMQEGTGKRTSPENPPPLESDRITAAEKAKQDKLKGIAAERSRVDDDIKQLNARKKGDESDVYIDEEIKNLTAKQNNLDLQYDKLGGDVRDLGRDPIVKQSSEEREASRKAFINTYGLPSNEPPAGEETHGGFGVQEGETTQAEDMSNVGAGDANVNKQKQADIDRDQILLNRKYQKEPVGSRKMKNGIIWTKTADRGWVHS